MVGFYILLLFFVILVCFILAYTISLKNETPIPVYGKGLDETFAVALLNEEVNDTEEIEAEITEILIEDEYRNRFSYASIDNVKHTGTRVTGYQTVGGYGPKNHLGNKDICGPVWNQQKCGSCWYMSTLQMILEKGVKDGNDLSPQTTNIPYVYNIGGTTLSGYWTEDRNVCQGGFPSHALALFRLTQVVPAYPADFTLDITSNSNLANACSEGETDCIANIRDWSGVSSQSYDIFSSDYSTQAYADISNFDPPDGTVVIAKTNVTNEQVQKLLYKYGPAVISVDASQWTGRILSESQAYKPSTYSRPADGQADHAVQLVGWRRRQGKLYWQIRNQWSPYWAFNGYIFVEAGTYILDCFYFVMFLKDNYVELNGYNSTTNGWGIAGNSIGQNVTYL